MNSLVIQNPSEIFKIFDVCEFFFWNLNNNANWNSYGASLSILVMQGAKLHVLSSIS